MSDSGESREEGLRPDFNRSIMMDFQGAKLTSDAGFLLLREIDQRHRIMAGLEDCLEDFRSPTHTRHSLVQMVRQRVYQVAAGYEDCNDADFLRVDPALRLALGKDHDLGASQSMLSRLENEVLGNEAGLAALDGALLRSMDALLKKRDKYQIIIDVDSTEDPAHGGQECVAYNGHFGKNCFHPLLCFTSDGDCLGARLRPGNVHSADGVLDFIDPIVKRYRAKFRLFWLRGDAAFADPEVYKYCEGEKVTYFIRLPSNEILKKLSWPALRRPAGRPPKSGVRVNVFDFRYQARSWDKPRRVVCKVEWHTGELFPMQIKSRVKYRKGAQVPVIELLDNSGNFLDLAQYYLLGKMYFPNNDDRVKDFVTSITLWAAEKAKHDPNKVSHVSGAINQIDGLSDEEKTTIIDQVIDKSIYNSVQPMLFPFGGFSAIRHCCESMPVTEEETDDRIVRALITGWLLEHAISINDNYPPTSMNKAVFVMENLLENLNFGNIKSGKSDRVIWAGWKEFKSVAHFWAAARIWSQEIFPEDPLSWLLNPNMFFPFLRVVRWYYDKGVSAFPQGQNRPILDPKIAWRVPDELIIEPLYFEYGNNDMLGDLLKKYRAPKKLL